MRESFYKFRDDVSELFKKNIKNISKRDVLQKELDIIQKKCLKTLIKIKILI